MPEKLSLPKLEKHIPSVYSMPKISSFKTTENKLVQIEVKIAWKRFLRIQ